MSIPRSRSENILRSMIYARTLEKQVCSKFPETRRDGTVAMLCSHCNRRMISSICSFYLGVSSTRIRSAKFYWVGKWHQYLQVQASLWMAWEGWIVLEMSGISTSDSSERHAQGNATFWSLVFQRVRSLTLLFPCLARKLSARGDSSNFPLLLFN